MRRIAIVAFVCLAALAVTPHATSAAPGGHWPQWRGPLGSGMAPDATPPVEWSEDHNIRWRVDAPGQGHSSPIVWGDTIYLLAAADTADGLVRYSVVAVNRGDGETRWARVATEAAPHEGIHQTSARASASAVTDGSRVFASFGSYGVYAYTVDGDLLWSEDLGDMSTRNQFGEGASPALHGERLVVPWDHEGASFIVALDAATGDEVWRKDRDERTSWNTPLVVDHGGRQQVIVNATNMIRSYDLSDGALIWECGGMTANAIPSPVHADGTVYIASGFRGSALFAIDLDRASGDITDSDAFVWTKGRDTPYVPSPLLTGDTLYYVKGNNAMLSAVDALTGEPRYPLQRLEGLRDVYSSPVSADGRVYLADRDGATIVIDGGAEFTVLATNQLDDKFSATPALVDGEIYLRGERYLYCIAAD